MTSPRHKLVQFLKAREQHLSLLPVKKTTPLTAGQVSKKTEADYPLVILAFDEAHALTNREENGYATWSNFSFLRYMLRALYRRSKLATSWFV